MSKLTDNDPMPFGIHKSEKMANVPAKYLIWLYENNKCSGPVRSYIEENLTVLKQEIKSHGS